MTETLDAIGQSHNAAAEPAFPWYCIRTRSNFERITAAALDTRGYQPFLPIYRRVRQWSDRIVESHAPLFPGYLFCRFDIRQRTPILTAPGVVSIIGVAGEPVAIPEDEIEAIRLLIHSGLPLATATYFREGQRVRINRGALEGVEGTLMKIKGAARFVVSIGLLQRSVTVEIDPSFVGGEQPRRANTQN